MAARGPCRLTRLLPPRDPVTRARAAAPQRGRSLHGCAGARSAGTRHRQRTCGPHLRAALHRAAAERERTESTVTLTDAAGGEHAVRPGVAPLATAAAELLLVIFERVERAPAAALPDPTGELKARELGARLTALRFDRIVSSPLQRARRTAELAMPHSWVEADDDLMESDYGAYEGRRTVDCPG